MAALVEEPQPNTMSDLVAAKAVRAVMHVGSYPVLGEGGGGGGGGGNGRGGGGTGRGGSAPSPLPPTNHT